MKANTKRNGRTNRHVKSFSEHAARKARKAKSDRLAQLVMKEAA
jgi:hypothetical protein